jgi:hypothetical protein
MPFLLGMLLIGRPTAVVAERGPQEPPAIGYASDADEAVLDVAAMNWE